MVAHVVILSLCWALLAASASQDAPRSCLTCSRHSDTAVSLLSTSHFISFEEWRRHHLDHNNTIANMSRNVSTSTTTEHSLAEPAMSEATEPSPESIRAIMDKMLPLDSKIYKDKFNYASADCAATVVETNAQARSAASILRENKDTYLINECAAPSKYVVIELCQDILVSLVVVGNFEFFSSMSRLFRFLVSDQFPATSWQILGEFEAKNLRDLQTFEIESPVIWARYLRLEVLSHYGSEFYCPLSIVRVHGKTMIEDFKEELPEKGASEDPLYPMLEVPGPTTTLDVQDNCPLLLPHLGLNEFLSDINSTHYCDLNGTHDGPISEPEAALLSLVKSTTQESIFKNIIKRLNLLEGNATLSLLYIEEQSRVLSRAFSDLDQKQRRVLDQLIAAVNVTVMSHLYISKSMFLQQLEELSASIRAQHSQHRSALADTQARVASLAHALTVQKRFSLLSSIVLICILIYVVLTRDAHIEEVPRPHIVYPLAKRLPLFAVGSLKKSKTNKMKKYRR